MSFSVEQAADFIENKLGLGDWKEQIQSSKFDFLFKLQNEFKKKIVYENISWGLRSKEELCTPTMEEVIHQCYVLGSGACLQLNFFLKLVLDLIGYDTIMVGCQTKTVPDPDSHCIIIAKFPDTENPNREHYLGPEFNGQVLYMVDVGFARPAPGIINLNELPHSYKAGGFTVQHHYNPELKFVERTLTGGNPIRGKFESETTVDRDAWFSMKPMVFSDFSPIMTDIFANPDYSFFLNTFFMFRHTTVNSHENFSFVSVLGRMVTIGTATERHETRYETYEEMVPVVLSHFPEVGEQRLRTVTELYTQRQQDFKGK